MVFRDCHLPRILMNSGLECMYESMTCHLPDATWVLRLPSISIFLVEPSIMSTDIISFISFCTFVYTCKISSLLLNQNEQDPFLLLNSRVHSYVWLLEVKKDYVNKGKHND